jgi:hypothetical protein
VGFGVAEADAHAQDLAGGQGDARLLGVYRVGNVIADPLVGSAREGCIIGACATQVAGESDDLWRGSLDDGVTAEVAGGVTGAELQWALLWRERMPTSPGRSGRRTQGNRVTGR